MTQYKLNLSAFVNSVTTNGDTQRYTLDSLTFIDAVVIAPTARKTVI